MARKYVDKPKPDPELQRLLDELNRLEGVKASFKNRARGRSKIFQENAIAQMDEQINRITQKIAEFNPSKPEI